MPATQGNSHMLTGRHMLFGLSGGLNVESESESTNDARLGAEFSMLYNRWYVGAEAYWMHVGFTKRQKIDDTFNYWGAYAQVGYFFTRSIQAGLRYDFMDRNGTGKDGFLNMPAAVVQLLHQQVQPEALGHVSVHRTLRPCHATRPRQRRPGHQHPHGHRTATIQFLRKT